MPAATVREAKRRRTRVYAIIPGLIPPAILTILRPLYALQESGGVEFRFGYAQRWSVAGVTWSDVVVFCRSNTLGELRALYLARQLGRRIVYDIDDNFFRISLGSPIGRILRHGQHLHVVRRFMQYADVTRVYSPLMLEEARARGANARLLRAYFDFSMIADLPHRERRADGPVRIAYATARAAGDNTELYLEEALDEVLKRNGQAVEVLFWREPPSRLKDYPNVRRLPAVPDYRAFVRRFYSLRPDIGLAPVLDTPFYRSKTDNKYREYGGCGVAGIYSNVDLYAMTVKDGETGLLADNDAASWIQAIERLIHDHDLRWRIAERARADVERRYGFDGFLADWRQTIDDALASERSASTPPSPEGLILAVIPSPVPSDPAGRRRRMHLRNLRSAAEGLGLAWATIRAADYLFGSVRLPYRHIHLLIEDDTAEALVQATLEDSAPLTLDFSFLKKNDIGPITEWIGKRDRIHQIIIRRGQFRSDAISALAAAAGQTPDVPVFCLDGPGTDQACFDEDSDPATIVQVIEDLVLRPPPHAAPQTPRWTRAFLKLSNRLPLVLAMPVQFWTGRLVDLPARLRLRMALLLYGLRVKMTRRV